MSLVVCSNEFNISSQSGIFNPADFKNYLDNPLELPPKSQVAVQSVKLNKLGSIVLNRFQRLGVYFGVNAIDTTKITDLSSVPILSQLKTSEGNTEEGYSYEDLVDKLEECLNFGLVHPDITAEVTLIKNASGTPINYTYKFTEKPVANSLNVRTDDWEMFPGTAGNISYNNSTTVITANATSEYNTIFNLKNPISLRHGIAEFLVPTSGTNFVVGLRRKVAPKTLRNPDDINLDYSDDVDVQFYYNNRIGIDDIDYDEEPNGIGTEHFYDYYVSVESGLDPKTYPDAAAGKRLFIRNLTYNIYKDEEIYAANSYVYQNVIYWGNDKSIENASEAPINWTTATGPGGEAYDRIKFSMKNEYIQVEIGNDNGYEQLTFHPDDYAGSGYDPKNYNLMKPIDDTTRLLYPQVFIGTKNKTITFNHWSGRVDSSQYDLNTRLVEQNRETDLKTAAFQWFYKTQVEGIKEGEDAPLRIINKLGTHSKLDNYDVLLLFEPSDFYNNKNPFENLTITDTFNGGGELLGFPENKILKPPYSDSVESGSEISFTYDSKTIPKAISVNSAFIRIKNLNLSTINAGLNRRSKIIYHIPRFDNSNNEVGEGLYFESPEKTYVDLNNSGPLTLSELNLDIVTQDETKLQDLTGRTIIVLHFREKPK